MLIWELWLIIMYLHHLEWNKRVRNLEKIVTDAVDLTNPSVTEFQTLDKTTKIMIKKITVSTWSLKIGELVGEGNFGQVHKGTLRNFSFCKPQAFTPIAVKILKQDQFSYTSSFLSEIKSLLLVRKHPNLVQIFGLNWKKSRLCILMEYCTLGNLENYLSELRTTFNPNPSSIYTITFPQNITQNELNQVSQWAWEIASAMEFIGTKKIVHADLAIRNVLLDANKVAKLTDFGMSIRLYNYQLYAKTKAQLLPWRWMAPEALFDLKFSSKSDVWAYGVTLWEMYTFGDSPWGNNEWSSDFLDQLRNGLKLEKPYLMPDDVYSKVMTQYILVDENRRITFPEIVQYTRKVK